MKPQMAQTKRMKRKATNELQPTTNNQQPVTNDQQPTTSDQ
jgi:hypothetical protein